MNIIYLRTSTEEQNPENQLKSCIELAKSLGITDYETIEEKQSAFKDFVERDRFNEILVGIKKKKVRNIIVWDWDRLYRNRKKLKGFFELCNAYKCYVYSVNQQWMQVINKMPEPWDEIMKEMFINILGWVAEDESKRKSERIKAAVRTSKGRTVSYKGNKWGRKALPKQTRDRVLELHKKGLSMRAIAKEAYYYDRSNNRKALSKSAVHKIISQNNS